jgi:hypothetical protein
MMNDKENKYDSTEIVTENRAYNKLSNFWYHNKWTVIVVTFFVVVIAVCTLQMIGKDKYDVSIVYGGTVRMSADERASFVGTLQDVLPKDYDNNGKKAVGLVEYQIFSEEEIFTEIETVIDGESVTLKKEQVALSWNTEQFSSMQSAVSKTGEYSLCFASPYVYEQLLKGYAVEGKTVRLGDTDFYLYNEAVQVLPADTVVCLLCQFMVGQSSKDEIYNRSVALFDAIVAYDVAE